MLISRLLRVLAVLFAVIMVAAWWMTRPQTIAATDLPDHQPDPAGGERVFWAGGCASCHASPVNGKRAKGDDKLLLGGGLELDNGHRWTSSMRCSAVCPLMAGITIRHSRTPRTLACR
jgi:mono/diheme cytochrome c family protein